MRISFANQNTIEETKGNKAVKREVDANHATIMVTEG